MSNFGMASSKRRLLFSYSFLITISQLSQHLDGINYFYLKKSGLYFVFTNKVNISAAYVVCVLYFLYSSVFQVELLTRLTKLFKDYCGVLTEESIRTNFVLIYELLDEIMV